ncbi:MAG: hypothetical protein Q8T08_19665, partial [Ignavibacteria bacterium]|nr:hypothetical protein [Ignavibacteria bacterium]
MKSQHNHRIFAANNAVERPLEVVSFMEPERMFANLVGDGKSTFHCSLNHTYSNQNLTPANKTTHWKSLMLKSCAILMDFITLR